MLAHVHIHKTAGTTLNAILGASFGLRHCHVPTARGKPVLSAADFARIQRFAPRLESLSGHGVCGCSRLEVVRPDVRYFTFVRDPFTRAASHYQYDVERRGYTDGLQAWIEKSVKRNEQVKRIAGKEASVDDAIQLLEERFLFVGLAERFDESLMMLLRRAEDPRLAPWYVSRNLARTNGIKDRLLGDRERRRLLEAANGLDRQLYDHVRHEIYPRFKRDYGASLDADVERFRRANEGRPPLSGRLRFGLSRVSRRQAELKRKVGYYG